MEYNSYIKSIKEKFHFNKIKLSLKKLENLNVLAIGDIIIDIYIFVAPKGRAIKDPILSTGFESEEKYAGGILAVSNHLSSYVNKIKLISLIGDKRSFSEFIKNSMVKNIELKTFVKNYSPTNVKKRYVDFYRSNKLFKVEYINDEPISQDLTEDIVHYLSQEIDKYNLVIVGDFGHGFINDSIRKVLEEKSKFLSINVQSNSANMGYNYISHYQNPDFVIMNEDELRLPLMKRFEGIQLVIKDFHNRFKYNKFLVTMGKQGCIFFNNGNTYKAPAVTNQVVDTVGAGDAVFAVSSLLSYINIDNEVLPFISNCAGAIKSEYMGNKESVTKEKLLNFIKKIYEYEMG